jgi:hypothetical protein
MMNNLIDLYLKDICHKLDLMATWDKQAMSVMAITNMPEDEVYALVETISGQTPLLIAGIFDDVYALFATGLTKKEVLARFNIKE